VGLAVIVSVGTFNVPLPVKRAQPDSRARNPIEMLHRNMWKILLGKGEVAKVLSSTFNFNMDSLVGPWGIDALAESFKSVKKPPEKAAHYQQLQSANPTNRPGPHASATQL